MGMTPPIEVANLGMWDSLILMVMALVVFGPRRLPEIGRQIGKLMYEVRKASNDFKFQMEEELRKAEDVDRRKKEEERRDREQGTGNREQLPALGMNDGHQLPNGVAGVPVVDGQFPIPSPYPEEGVYPPVTAPVDFQIPKWEPGAPAETKVEETYPRILPPSTGEPVPAARPGSVAAPAEAGAEAHPAEMTPVSGPETEKANHA
jgi:sec-independent protein translocase protein TatB